MSSIRLSIGVWYPWFTLFTAMVTCIQAQAAVGKDGGWIELFNGIDLTGWQNGRDPGGDNRWFVESGTMTDQEPLPCNDIATVQAFRDFDLKLEYKLSSGGNGGVYLRGRVEIQALDSFGTTEPGIYDDGAIWGQFAPKVNASKPAGEWNTLEVSYVGDTVTVSLNNEIIHDNQRIEVPTEDALPGGVNDPGPILLQGTLGKIWYRNIMIRPCPRECPYYKDVFDDQWNKLKAPLSLGSEPIDVDADGLPEQWALRLVALILCEDRWPYQLIHDEVYDAYTQNLLTLEQESSSVQPYKDVLAALLLISADLKQYFITELGLSGSYTVFSDGGKINAKSPSEPFSGTGDIDDDGITNADEYTAVATGGGSIETFAQMALYWNGAGPLPVAGLVGMAILLGLIAIGGVTRTRRA